MDRMSLDVTRHGFKRAKERTPYHGKDNILAFAEAAYWCGKRLIEDESIKNSVRKALAKRERYENVEVRVYRGQVCIFSNANKSLITIYGVHDYKKIVEDSLGKSVYGDDNYYDEYEEIA